MRHLYRQRDQQSIYVGSPYSLKEATELVKAMSSLYEGWDWVIKFYRDNDPLYLEGVYIYTDQWEAVTDHCAVDCISDLSRLIDIMSHYSGRSTCGRVWRYVRDDGGEGYEYLISTFFPWVSGVANDPSNHCISWEAKSILELETILYRYVEEHRNEIAALKMEAD